MIRNPTLRELLAEVSVVFADSFTDPELGPSFYMRWTRQGRREAAVIDAAELAEVRRLVRQVNVRAPA